MASDSAIASAVPRNSDKPAEQAPAGTAARVGTTLGKYRLLSVVGQGGMGVVYEGEDAVLQRRVAVKLLPDSVIVDARARERFLNEARAAARLNHPHAVTIYEIARVGTTYYIAMELVRGGSMQEQLKAQGPLAWAEATRVVADACRGLAAAHAAGLVHRDIKPANIMRSATGLVKLSDFGLACIVGQPTGLPIAPPAAAGTPHFMSPEQCRNDQLDERSDLYSLGATYYALLTGRPPYVADQPIEVLFAHCSQEIPDPRQRVPEVPEACAAIIARAMAKYPAERYNSAQEMLTALEQILPGAPQTPPDRDGPETTAGAEPPKRRFRASRGVAAVIGVGLLLAGAAWYFDGLPLAGDKTPTPDELAEAVAVPAPPGATATDPAGEWRAKIPREGLALPMVGQVAAIAFSPDGRWLAAGCLDGEGGVRIWDLDRLELRTELWPGRRFRCLAYSPDSQLLIAGGEPFEDRGIRLWSVRKGGQQALSTEFPPRSVTFDNAGRQLAAAFERPSPEASACVKVWRVTAGREVISREQLTLQDFVEDVATTLFNRDGKQVLCVGGKGDVQVRDIARGELRQKFSAKLDVACAALAPDGRTLAVVGANELQFWNPSKGAREDVRRIVGALQCVAYRRDGKLLATGAQSGLVTLWNAATHEETQNLRGHNAAVLGLAFSADGRLLASAGADRTVRLWNVGEVKP